MGEEELRRYVRDAAGDVRQAINLLQGSQQVSPAEGDGSGRYKDRDVTVSEAFNGFFGGGGQGGGDGLAQGPLDVPVREGQGDPQERREVGPAGAGDGEGARGGLQG